MAESADCRGLSCPEPVVLARQALQQAKDIIVTVTVSNAVARDNVSRAAKSMGWKVNVETDEDYFILNINK